MNIAKMIVGIQKELNKKRKNEDIECAISAIFDELFMDYFDSEYVCIDYFKIYGNSISYCGDDSMNDKQKISLFLETKSKLIKLSKELESFGFKCKTVAWYEKNNPSCNNKPLFQTPYIIVKFK